jgi:hypothetical protein
MLIFGLINEFKRITTRFKGRIYVSLSYKQSFIDLHLSSTQPNVKDSSFVFDKDLIKLMKKVELKSGIYKLRVNNKLQFLDENYSTYWFPGIQVIWSIPI